MSWKRKKTHATKKHRRPKMGGGFFDFLGTSTTTNNYGASDSSTSDWFNMESFTKGASDFWNKTKKAASDSYSSMSSNASSYSPSSIPVSHVEERKEMPTPTYVPPPSYTQPPPLPSQPQYMTPFGGKRMRKSRRMRGGYSDYVPTTGLAANAAPFSGYTAQPQVWVGGKMKTKKRRAIHKKNKRGSRKHQRR